LEAFFLRGIPTTEPHQAADKTSSTREDLIGSPHCRRPSRASHIWSFIVPASASMLMSLLPALLMSTAAAAAPPAHAPAGGTAPTICPNPSYVCCWPPSRLDPEHAQSSTRGGVSSRFTHGIFENQLTLEVGGPTALLAFVYEAITGSKTGKAKR